VFISQAPVTLDFLLAVAAVTPSYRFQCYGPAGTATEIDHSHDLRLIPDYTESHLECRACFFHLLCAGRSDHAAQIRHPQPPVASFIRLTELSQIKPHSKNA
jgi:hypothetical protein